MKTAEEWSAERARDAWEGKLYATYDIESAVEFIRSVQRDAYRQGLLDSAKSACERCMCDEFPEPFGERIWWHGERLCYASQVWNLLREHDAKGQP